MSNCKITYKINKKAKIGEELKCPICTKNFVKHQYSQAFCCGKCKDTFWNRKGDRHSIGYYERYDNIHSERKLRKAIYSIDVINARDEEELYARMALYNDIDFKRYINDIDDIDDIPSCNVDLATLYKNYLCK